MVQKAGKDGHLQRQHLKPDLNKLKNLAAEPARNDIEKTDETLNLDLAGLGIFQTDHISGGLQAQAESLTNLRDFISNDIALGDLRDTMLAHLPSFEKLASVIETRDELFYTQWLTETRNNERRKKELNERENELDKRENGLDKYREGLDNWHQERKIELDEREKDIEVNGNSLNKHIDSSNAWRIKAESDLRAREKAVSVRGFAAQLGCQVM